MIEEAYVGFYRPRLRDHEGRIDVRGWLGHCEMWGYTSDGTWLFLDPQARGTRVRITHHFDEVQAHLKFRFQTCDMILRLPVDDPDFRLPLHGMMTCASICGSLVGVRALLPSTLRRRLLAKGAEVIHGTQTKGRSGG